MSLVTKFCVYVLIVSMLGSTLMVPLAYIDYELRRDYISEILCINKDMPETGCNGKCFLLTRLKQATDPGTEDSSQLLERFQLSFFNQMGQELLIRNEFNDIKPMPVLTPVCQSSSYIGDIFHPPRI